MNHTISKVLYGLLFCLVLPGLLIWWASNVSVNIPMGDWQFAGWVASGIGMLVVLKGMYDLWRYGKGLPMNAFPPSAYVSRGAFTIFRHPIYTGFCMTCAGVSCIVGSSAGLYLITPAMVLACWALVKGYEQPDLEKRFRKINHRSVFSPPQNSLRPASASEKIFPALSVFIVWMLVYEVLIFIGVRENFIDTTLAFEKEWPVIPFAEIPYFTTYIFVVVAPLITKDKTQLRAFIHNAWWIVAIGLFFQVTFPFYAAPRPIDTTGLLSDLMGWERLKDGPSGAFPSFHVMWSLVAASAWSRAYPRQRWLWIVMALLICWSCSATGVHSLLDIIAGAAVFAIVTNRRSVWNSMQQMSQRLANSWRSYTVGSFRVINHSVYAFLAGFAGIGITSVFIANPVVLIIITGTTLLGGAIWGQWVEGSSNLLRPFGYYGAILGGIAGVVICDVALQFPWQQSIGTFAIACPWVQAIGRLRCLVQGCCHGRLSDSDNGIVYWNEHSRVCKISALKGKVIHNTQLYSIVSNVIIGFVLWRVWYGGATPTMGAGLYLILSGTARFVEESYRGEVQTKIAGGLPIYQWAAIASMFSGALMTTFNTAETLSIQPPQVLTSLICMTVAGLASAFAMGMDFPKSNVPFSRLTG